MCAGWSMTSATFLLSRVCPALKISVKNQYAFDQLKQRVSHFWGRVSNKSWCFPVSSREAHHSNNHSMPTCHMIHMSHLQSMSGLHILDRIDVLQTLLSLVLCGLYAPWSRIPGPGMGPPWTTIFFFCE